MSGWTVGGMGRILDQLNGGELVDLALPSSTPFHEVGGSVDGRVTGITPTITITITITITTVHSPSLIRS